MIANRSMTLQQSPVCRMTAFSHGRPKRALTIRRANSDGPKETSKEGDSYSKIEAPVRDTIPDQGPPVSERNQFELIPQVKGSDALKPFDSDISADDALRFTGAIPEVANSRLAMLGVVAAIGAELGTGLNVFQQFQLAPGPIVATFFLFTIATAVPVFRGQPRTGNSFFSSDAEIINGRVAMLGFVGIILSTFYKGHALWFLG